MIGVDNLLTVAVLGLIVSGALNRRWYASTALDLTWTAACLTSFVHELAPHPHVGSAVWCLAFAVLWLYNAHRSARRETRQQTAAEGVEP